MERGHEFTISLPGHGTYVVRLLEGVQIARQGATTIGRWPALNMEATGDDEAEVYQELLGSLQQRMAAGPGSPGFESFADYVRENGIRLSDEDAAGRELARLRQITVRWHDTDDEQYMVRLWQDIEVRHDGDNVTVGAFGLQASGHNIGQALQALNGAVNEACGERDAPGPRYEEITGWVRSNGEPVADEVLAQEAREKLAYVVARDKLVAIRPQDIPDESSTGVPLLVDFWAEWCGPCRRVTPVLTEISEKWAGRIVVRTINVDQFDGIWEQFGFRGIPTMIVFRDGREVHRVIGFAGKERLVAELQQHLA